MQIEDSPVKPLDAKTWGDGLYAVFDSPHDGAEFALGFLDRTLDVDWTAAGFRPRARSASRCMRGPFSSGFDPVMGRDGFFGSSVTRAARIEPVTQPGTIYASEAFAATLAAAGQRDSRSNTSARCRWPRGMASRGSIGWTALTPFVFAPRDGYRRVNSRSSSFDHAALGQPHLPRTEAPQLPPVLHRPGAVGHRHVAAAGRDGLARLPADGLRVAARRRRILRERGHSAVQQSRRRARRSHRPPPRPAHDAVADARCRRSCSRCSSRSAGSRRGI